MFDGSFIVPTYFDLKYYIRIFFVWEIIITDEFLYSVVGRDEDFQLNLKIYQL